MTAKEASRQTLIMFSLSIQIGHGENPVASNPSDDIEVVTMTTTIKEDEDNFALEENQDDLVIPGLKLLRRERKRRCFPPASVSSPWP